MFSLVKEILETILLPPTSWGLLLLTLSVLSKRAWARKAMIVLVVFVVFLHSGVTALFFSHLLEARYQPLYDPSTLGQYDAIVVLLGSPILPNGKIPFETLDEISFYRLDEAWRLYKHSPKPVIVSGGATNSMQGVRKNKIACDYLGRWGIPDDIIIPEAHSRDTFESAREVRKILDGRGWRRYLLVTSAQHMRRSMLVFDDLSHTPIPAPADFKTVQFSASAFELSEDSADDIRSVLYELAGLLVYRLRLLVQNSNLQ